MSDFDPKETRQGSKGTPILLILIVALALCAVVFIGLGIYGWLSPDPESALDMSSPAPAIEASGEPDGPVEPGEPATAQ
ncbi:hypothetical protein SAMN06297251_111102 [Fulvimarina manganoxydans]|uniref:Uncharacterized protein n=1 Tax=Fulvimarina manganoxydans TaxID=937218 RepID=A0A1W2CU91_9HYPH|nr:hypothetical protein [Fulvimarina manganoxydans]SMC88442.1 hypothetical protein SAMN06297251_111102 [Fulvimarina manganoxydans]